MRSLKQKRYLNINNLVIGEYYSFFLRKREREWVCMFEGISDGRVYTSISYCIQMGCLLTSISPLCYLESINRIERPNKSILIEVKRKSNEIR